MAKTNGHQKLLQQLRADGLTTIFGNPGSSEEGFLDEVSRFPDVRYILGLQEAAVLQMADGYAQATGRPAIAQLHCSVGLGNGIGSLFHAKQRQTPLVVLVGEAGVSVDAMDAHMAADLVAMAAPVTKYAVRCIDPRSLLRLFRRCIKMAATPPYGPVVFVMPQDMLDAENDEPVVPTVIPSTRVVPEQSLLTQAAEMMAGAENPIILMGDGIVHSGAQEELARFAETLGAGVWGVMSSEMNLPWTHPLYCGMTGHMFGNSSARIVGDADVVVACGTDIMPEVFPLLTNPFRADAKVIHIDLDPYQIAKNHPVTLGLVSDPKLTLGALADALGAQMNDAQKAAAGSRVETISTNNARARQEAKEADQARRGSTPLFMSEFAEELSKRLPDDTYIFDESLTHFPEFTRWVTPSKLETFFQTPGGTLGVGIPGAVGVKVAHPDKTVIGLTGDGGSMYTFQAIWTAAHYGLNPKFIVCNNHSYRLLKFNLVDYWQEQGLTPEKMPASFPPPFDILEPEVDFVGLARALGAEGQRVSQPSEIGPAIDAMLKHDGPYLIDLVLEREVPRPEPQ
ncbi:MAG: thiamine pyrophosphate-binding protein [Hyphomicrobiales bacterium]|nr:thiamine pyrophosphate-binding protein [Hyphomicrobiales bacterium]